MDFPLVVLIGEKNRSQNIKKRNMKKKETIKKTKKKKSEESVSLIGIVSYL